MDKVENNFSPEFPSIKVSCKISYRNFTTFFLFQKLVKDKEENFQ
jgi:hypothetical protein